MSTERRSRTIGDARIHRTPMVLAGLLVASFTAGAVLTSGLPIGRLVPEHTGAAGAAVTETSPGRSEGLAAEQRAIDFHLSEKGILTEAQLAAEQRAIDFRLSEKGLPTRFEPR